MKPRGYFEYDSTPNCHFLIIDKNKKEVTIGEGSVAPFVTKKIKLEDFLPEEFVQFSPDKIIDMKNYVNS